MRCKRLLSSPKPVRTATLPTCTSSTMLHKTFLWPLLCAATFAALPSIVLAASSDEDKKEALAFIRSLPFEGEWPALTGFSSAQPVKGFEALPGDHGHTQAYRNAAGCVAFFYPPGEENVSDVALKWRGPPAMASRSKAKASCRSAAAQASRLWWACCREASPKARCAAKALRPI